MAPVAVRRSGRERAGKVPGARAGRAPIDSGRGRARAKHHERPRALFFWLHQSTASPRLRSGGPQRPQRARARGGYCRTLAIAWRAPELWGARTKHERENKTHLLKRSEERGQRERGVAGGWSRTGTTNELASWDARDSLCVCVCVRAMPGRRGSIKSRRRRRRARTPRLPFAARRIRCRRRSPLAAKHHLFELSRRRHERIRNMAH